MFQAEICNLKADVGVGSEKAAEGGRERGYESSERTL